MIELDKILNKKTKMKKNIKNINKEFQEYKRARESQSN